MIHMDGIIVSHYSIIAHGHVIIERLNRTNDQIASLIADKVAKKFNIKELDVKMQVYDDAEHPKIMAHAYWSFGTHGAQGSGNLDHK